MIIVRLLGGLGNQLFQYALGRWLAHQYNVPLKLDINSFQDYPLRGYKLDIFNIAATLATPDEIDRLTRRKLSRTNGTVFRFIQRQIPYYYRAVVQEQGFGYDPNICKVRKNAYLEGYWQSELYFDEIEDILRRELMPRHSPSTVNTDLLQYIEETTSVGIHIRRGDYVSNPEASRFHGNCSLEYYSDAIEYIRQQVPEAAFFVFSDDMTWVKQHLTISHSATYVEHNEAKKDYEDLRLMSHCKHHIIANSSFSWWGAWLGKNPNQLVVAPKQWFADPKRQSDHPAPARWHRL